MIAEHVAEGGCLCGAVRLRALGEPRSVPYCHCRDCRKGGAPVSVFAEYGRERVEMVSKTLEVYESSPGVRRSFCRECGSSIAYEDERLPGEIYVHVGVFDEPERFEPTGHSWYSRRLEWLALDDDLPRHGQSTSSR